MLSIICDDENFYEVYEKKPLPVVLFGAGNNLKRFLGKLSHIDMICDNNKVGEFIDDMEIKPGEAISSLGRETYVLITASNEEVYKQIVNTLKTVKSDLFIVWACKNTAFSYSFWDTEIQYVEKRIERRLSVNLVCYDDSWIFSKFARKMAECLEKENIDVTVSSDTRSDVDINHHIPYIAYQPFANDTVMITHVDNMAKVRMLKKQLSIAGLGICMSKDTMDKLTSYGIDRSKLCYINPAHDSIIQPHKYLIGITHKCHDDKDVRKRATALLDVIEGIDSRFFSFFIMGGGWNDIVKTMREKGFEVNYYDEFDYETYVVKMQEIDYFFYMGFDEGTMGYLDALTAGAGTIVTPQGYHLDADCPIDYPCRTISDFRNAFMDLQNKRKKRIDSVREWTWESYTKKHVDIWKYLTKRVSLKELFANQSFYEDGIYSAFLEDNRV